MKVLLDTCVAASARHVLRERGHEVEHVADWSQDPGDAAILARATNNRQVVATLDKDFGELAVVGRQAHCGIVRLVDIASNQQGLAIAAVLERYGHTLSEGAIITAEPARTRVRPPESDESS